MRTAEFLADEDLSANDSELHLGMGSLLGVFFGLTLVCGVFFGFGYMMGHRTPGASTSSDPLYVQPATQSAAPKPSAQIANQPTDSASVVVPTQSSAASVSVPPVAIVPAPVVSAPANKTSPENVTTTATNLVPQAKPASPPAASAPVTAPPSLFALKPAVVSSGTIMVQIAAVKSRPDAEALAAALQKNGFSPTVRSEPQDKLLHVQIGPFSSHEEAKAMRQKLSSAGYNAFIK